MGQTFSDSGDSKPATVQGTYNPGVLPITPIWDMNSTIASPVTILLRDGSDHRTTVSGSDTGRLWTWDIVHIAVVSTGITLLLLVCFALVIFCVYYKRVLKPRGANVSFGVSPPSHNRARSTIFNSFAAEEAARRTAEEIRKRSPSPQSVGEDIPMTILRDMQNEPTIEYDDDRGNHHQDTELDGVFHHNDETGVLNHHNDAIGDPQYNELPHRTITLPPTRNLHHPSHQHRHTSYQGQSHSQQRFHYNRPRRLASDLNGNITFPTMPLPHYGSNSRKFLADQRLDLLNRQRGRLLSEPIGHRLSRRTCTCSMSHRPDWKVKDQSSVSHRLEPRILSGNRRIYGSYRPMKLPKLNLAGETIPSSSEPSLIYSGTRAPENSLSPDGHQHHHGGGHHSLHHGDGHHGHHSRHHHEGHHSHHHHESYDINYNNNQDFYPNSYGSRRTRTAYTQGRNTPTPRLVVPTNTPNSCHSGAGSVSLCGGATNGNALDSDFGASAGASQCNVSSDTSMAVAIGTGCPASVAGSVAEMSYEWDGYDPAYSDSQMLGYLDGVYFPILHTRQYWV